jgi:hypothetical protein
MWKKFEGKRTQNLKYREARSLKAQFQKYLVGFSYCDPCLHRYICTFKNNSSKAFKGSIHRKSFALKPPLTKKGQER